MTYTRFIALLGIFLSSVAPAVAQKPPPQSVQGQVRAAPAATMLRPVSTPSLNASFRLYQDPGTTVANFSFVPAEAYGRDFLVAPLPPMYEVKTLLFTESSVPLARLWSGRLQLNGFQNTIFIQNLQLDPLGYGGALDLRPPRRIYPGGPRSVELVGVSVSFHFGREARAEHSTQAWRCVTRIFSNIFH